MLFGPVSISNDYKKSSQQLLVEFLRANNRLPELSRMVRARNPFKCKTIAQPGNPHTQLTDIEKIVPLISEIEQNNKGIPILLKQYLKLGGTITLGHRPLPRCMKMNRMGGRASPASPGLARSGAFHAAMAPAENKPVLRKSRRDVIAEPRCRLSYSESRRTGGDGGSADHGHKNLTGDSWAAGAVSAVNVCCQRLPYPSAVR